MLEVSTLQVDERTFYGVKKVNIRGKSIDTPKKSVNLENLREDIGIHAELLGEIYKPFDRERIESLIMDEEKQVKFNYDMNKLVKKAQLFSVEMMIFIPGLGYLNPSENELTFIIATQKQYSDFYVVPTVERLNKLMKSGSFSIQDYINLIKDYLSLLEGYPEKAVMGMVPINIPYQFIGDLMSFYLDKGIESFCIDVGGRVALSLAQQIIEVQRTLLKNKIDAFIHATNINIGRAKKGSNVITAKDVLSFGLGFDSIGDNHLRPYIRDDIKNPGMNLRLFDKDAYGYHKIQEVREIMEIYPADSRVKPEYLLDDSLYRRRKAQTTFNYEQIGMETERLRRVMNERAVGSYVKNKRYVDDNSFKAITKVKESVSKVRSLEEFLR
ncbi:MAG: hypothetical protein N2V75_06780 [Methanophagales archaeon]|nr:hypothetical protein [Methanophagales archaeon]